MDFSTFQRLGERIAEDYRGVQHDELRLPAIAAEALRGAEFPAIDFGAIAQFLCETDIVQEPGNRFSDLPLIVYRSHDFYIQLLVWNESTTTIHQHAFTGAFRVLQGSSIHSRYSFEEEQRVSSRLLLGDVRLEGVELLRKGAVREILPGQDGLLHSLFHLDHPSATVVVRTARLPWATPQYSIARPCFAVDEPALRNDSQVRVLRRALYAAQAADGGSTAAVLQTMIPALDFPRLFMLHGEIDTVLPDATEQAAFIETLRVHYGALADRYREALEAARVQRSLLQARGFSTDPEVRFFFALLLNVPDRDGLLGIVKENFPDDDPAQRCAGWISRMVGTEGLLDALVRNGALQQAKKRSRGLVERLRGLLPDARDERDALLGDVLGGNSTDGEKVAVQLREVPELAPLFR